MKIILTLIVGLHLFLGSIALAGVGMMEPLQEVNMTPLVTMSLAMEEDAPASECASETKTVVSTPGVKSTCPTAVCIAESDNDTHAERTSLVFRPSEERTSVALPKAASPIDQERFAHFFQKEDRSSTTLAFHFKDVILKE